MSKANRRRPAAKANKGLPVFPIAITAIVLLGVVAIVMTVAGGDTGSDLEVAPVTATGDPLPPMVDMGQPDPAVGAAAPELVGEDFDGEKVEIRNDGRAKVIAFVAHWCSHCQAEVPKLSAYLEAQGMPEGVDLYFVSTAVSRGQPNYPPSDWLDREGVGDVPTILDEEEQTAHAAFGSGGFPFMVVLDSEHKVSARTTGELPDGTYDELFGAVSTEQG